MRFEKQWDDTHIFVEDGENEEMVLRAIAHASFELANQHQGAELHGRHAVMNPADSADMPRNMFDVFISVDGPGPALNLDSMRGRNCKTLLIRREEGHFELNDYGYRQDRGDPAFMLDRAKAILAEWQSSN